ncbi:conserved exported hypothetical protein [Serratia proteamaculans]|uniref:DUF1120 domain-containing protein n=1 Tax=Serratia proteamaculans TaxID=28151 RepID=UPI0009F8010D|nr:DUF1120 domain-containing protein [Serratia proteamaculans]SMB38639.1 conserved exported hypothetical protein [Serratia proteamaculans]
MKKTLLATTLATITLISASSAYAADSVDLKVGGTIASTACTPTLSGGGSVDYGDIKADILNQDSYTALPKKLIDITITCDGMTKLAIRPINNRPGSIGEGTSKASEKVDENGALSPNPSDGANATVVGLGTDGPNKIGSYLIRFDSATVTGDNKSLVLLAYSDTGKGWMTGYNRDFYQRFIKNVNITWGTILKGDFGTPSAVKTMVGKISIQPYIAKASSLDLTKPIKLDGSTTIELTYL